LGVGLIFDLLALCMDLFDPGVVPFGIFLLGLIQLFFLDRLPAFDILLFFRKLGADGFFALGNLLLGLFYFLTVSFLNMIYRGFAGFFFVPDFAGILGAELLKLRFILVFELLPLGFVIFAA
jgi:hypothetical protein